MRIVATPLAATVAMPEGRPGGVDPALLPALVTAPGTDAIQGDSATLARS